MTQDKPKAGRGGKRPGSGPKLRKGPDTPASSALEYLQAVATGAIEGDSLRVAAAKAVLPFEAPRQRVPLKGLTPSAQRASEAAAADDEQSAAWAQTVARIKAKRGAA